MERFVVFLAAAGIWLADAWGLMVTVGVAHGSWWAVIPVMGYGTALTLSFISVVSLVVVVLLLSFVKELL